MWTIEELTFITEEYFRLNSIVAAQRSFKARFQVLHAPSRKIILRCVRNFGKTGSIQLETKGKKRTSRTNENIENVKQVMERSHQKSVRRLSQEVGVSKTSVHRILKLDLGLYPYKIKISQQIKENDKISRL